MNSKTKINKDYIPYSALKLHALRNIVHFLWEINLVLFIYRR